MKTSDLRKACDLTSRHGSLATAIQDAESARLSFEHGGYHPLEALLRVLPREALEAVRPSIVDHARQLLADLRVEMKRLGLEMD